MSDAAIMICGLVARIDRAHQEAVTRDGGGCKSSCRTTEVGYHESRAGFEERYWFVRFGGYCIGDLARETEVKAPSLEELYDKVDALLRREVAK